MDIVTKKQLNILIQLAEADKHFAKIERELARVFHKLAHYEVPKKYILLDQDFSIGSGELTPKMSVKRKAVEAANRDAIEALYAEGAAG